MQLNKKIFISTFIIILCFAIDRLSKFYIIDFFIQNDFRDQYINPYLNFIIIWNKGIAFGLLESGNFFYNMISIIIFLVIIVICYLIYKSNKKYEVICYSLVVSGALGNFMDRIYYKAVPDFIDLHYNDFHWFTFNVADIFITFGILLLLTFDMFKLKNKVNE